LLVSAVLDLSSDVWAGCADEDDFVTTPLPLRVGNVVAPTSTKVEDQDGIRPPYRGLEASSTLEILLVTPTQFRVGRTEDFFVS